MLLHHSNSDYATAASDAATRARDQLEGLIARGRDRASTVLEKVHTEVPQDYLVPSQRLHFGPSDDGVVLDFRDAMGAPVLVSMHRHALGQVADKVSLPRRYAFELMCGDLWQRDLVAHNLNELARRGRDGSYLVRTVDSEVRGFLSDRFRRLDSRPIIDAFAGACGDLGAVPVEGYWMQTKVAIKALLPTVFEPVDNEVLAIGVVLQNSDYGHGALSIRTFVLRLWCTNFAIADEMLRQVHLGRRLDEQVQFSTRTFDLDTQTIVSATRDIVQSAFSDETVGAVLEGVRQANELEVSPSQIGAFLKRNFRKDEATAIKEAFASADVVNMPPGQTQYRLSNAISWIAGQTDDDVRRLEMQQVAGQLLAA